MGITNKENTPWIIDESAVIITRRIKQIKVQKMVKKMGLNKHNKNTAEASLCWNLASYYLYMQTLENVLRVLESLVEHYQVFQVFCVTDQEFSLLCLFVHWHT